MRWKQRRYLLGLLVMTAAALLPSQASAASSVSLVTYGLDSPRGITFIGSRAAVAESGHGGSTCFGPGGPCAGDTSKITWVDPKTGNKSLLAGGFFSIHLGGPETIGVSGLSASDGLLYAQIGATGRELPPNYQFGQAQAGHLFAVNLANGNRNDVASVGNFDFDYTLQFTPPNPAFFGNPGATPPVLPDPSKFNPNAQEHDANPTSVLATEEGLLVADSGANTLTRVSDEGGMKVVHHFQFNNPNPMSFPSDAVPTCVAQAGDSTYVGMLSGQLFRVHGSSATEVVPHNSSGQPLLSHVTGCTAKKGTLYLVNMFGFGPPFSSASFFRGSVVQFNTKTGTASELADSATSPVLSLPYTPAIGPDGNLYVTAGSICDTAGDSPNPPGTPGPNPCKFGDKPGDVKPGGKVVKITLPSSNDEGGGDD
jgi:hypothetical protein